MALKLQKDMKKIRNILLAALLFAGSVSLTACSEPDEAMDTLVLERVLSPLDFQLSMEANVNATFTWKAMNASKEYLIEVVREDGSIYESRTLTYDPSSAETLTLSAEFAELPALSKFTARLCALSDDDRVADSNPVEIAFETGIENLFLGEGLVPDEDITATTAVMRWKAGSTVTHLDVDNEVGKIALDETAIADGVYTLTGLTTGKTYVVRLYNEAKDAYRGSCTFVASDKIDLAVDDKTSSSISIAWGADVTLTAVGILDESKEETEPTVTTLSAAQIAARRFTFEGLEAQREYRLSAYDDGVECAALYVVTLGESTAWDFTKWEIASWTEPTTIENLTIIADGDGKNVEIRADADFGCNYLDLRGKSTIAKDYTTAPTQRAISFPVKGEGVLVIDCYANGAGRNFYTFVDVLGKSYGPVEAPVKADRGKVYIPCPEIPGAAVVYLFTDATINHIYSMEWYPGNEAPGQHAEKLATPVVECDPAEITKGDATAVRFSWGAVANAATYDYKITVTKMVNGAEEVETLSGNISATEYTLAADVAAQLKPGDYTFTVNAVPASSYKYAPSSAGSIALKVNDTKLTAPEVTFEPAKVTVGTATEVVASWPAVDGAASYDVTFNEGAVENVTDTKYTVSAAAVAALAVGEYTISVVAKPAETSAQVSDAGTAKLIVAEATVGPGTPLSWSADDFEAIWAGFANSTGDINAAALATMTETADLKKDADGFTYKGLSFLMGGGKFKFGQNNNAEGTKALRFQFGGTGSMTKANVSFTVDGPGTLVVEAVSGGDAARPLAVNIDGTETTQDVPDKSQPAARLTFDGSAASAGSIVTIYSKNSGINVFSIVWTPAGDPGPGPVTGTEYTMTLQATAGVVTPNITGLPTSWKADDATWTATDDTGASTVTFTGNVYYSNDAAKNVVWYFNKGKDETHVAATEMGKIKSIALYPTSNREPDYLKCTCNAGTAVAAVEPLATKTSVITFDFEAAGVTADNFRIDYDKGWIASPSNVEVNKVVIVYTK